MNQKMKLNFKSIALAAVACIVLALGLFIGVPYYNVWQQEMSGRAELAKAEQNRQIKIQEAKANLEAEKLNAQAEVERAKGAAEAIKIENGSLTENYIKYLWVRYQRDNTGKTIIYVPSGDMGIPVTEAARLQGED